MALTCVVTMLIAIPVPATEGYVNFGDTILMIAGGLFGPLSGFLVGGMGSALADLFLGYTHWVPFTFLIKGVEGLLMGLLWYRYWKQTKTRKVSLFLMLSTVLSALWMVLGYFLAETILYTMPVAILSIPNNAIQGGVSAVLAVCGISVLQKFSFFRKDD